MASARWPSRPESCTMHRGWSPGCAGAPDQGHGAARLRHGERREPARGGGAAGLCPAGRPVLLPPYRQVGVVRIQGSIRRVPQEQNAQGAGWTDHAAHTTSDLRTGHARGRGAAGPRPAGPPACSATSLSGAGQDRTAGTGHAGRPGSTSQHARAGGLSIEGMHARCRWRLQRATRRRGSCSHLQYASRQTLQQDRTQVHLGAEAVRLRLLGHQAARCPQSLLTSAVHGGPPAVWADSCLQMSETALFPCACCRATLTLAAQLSLPGDRAQEEAAAAPIHVHAAGQG